MGRTKVMLHACCGPCLLEPFDALASDHEVTVVYANPNIHPREEYERRRDTLAAYAEERGIEVVEVPYEPSEWERAVEGAAERPERCRRCFRLRMGLAAREASSRGFDAFATTLTVSPYQDQEAVLEAGRDAAREAGIAFLETDYRERYPDAVRRSRGLGMYRQNFCGCGPSRDEADRERAVRREERKRRR